MSAQVIAFPVKRVRRLESLACDPGNQLVEAIRQKILAAGGTWDSEKFEPRVQRIISLLAEGTPISGHENDH